MRKGLYYIILLSYYSENLIAPVYKEVDKRLSEEEIDYEFIIIDDGSKDNSYQVATKLEEEHNNVRAYQLSRNYTAHYAKFAGFSIAKSDIVTSMPDDWQTPMDVYINV